MARKTITLFAGIILVGCTLPGTDSPQASTTKSTSSQTPADSGFAANIMQIPLPQGYHRVAVEKGSFADFLRNIPLKRSKTVLLYNGQPKRNQDAHYAILDMPVGKKDLQQCADAVMRLKAEYLFSKQEYDRIVFTDNERVQYKFTAPFTRANFERYLERVFGMCGSASLERELQAVTPFSDIQAGDVLIRGGFPGHAEIVTDVAVNDEGKKIYLLAQSYMPAQDIHILKNPANSDDNPWYDAEAPGDEIVTPEYSFWKQQLGRWPSFR